MPNQPLTLNQNQMCYLNILRFASCLIVFIGHYFQTFVNRLLEMKTLEQTNPFLAWLFHLPSLGVMIFFVLSGFLITYSTLHDVNRHGRFSISHYAAKRCYRIFPPLWFALGLTMLIFGLIKYFNLFGAESFVLPGDLYSIRAKASLPFKEIAQNFLLIPGATGGFNGPLWSLSYEFFYYILFALFMLSAINKEWHLSLVGFCFIGLVLGGFIFLNQAYVTAISVVFKYSLIWLFGAALAFLFMQGFIGRIKKEVYLALFILGLIGFLNALPFFLQHETPEWFFYGLLCLLFICYCLKVDYTPSFLGKLFAKGSQYTYTLYLIHFPLCLFALSLIGYDLLDFTLWHYVLLFAAIMIIGNSISFYAALIVEDRHLMQKWAAFMVERLRTLPRLLPTVLNTRRQKELG